MEDLIGVAFIPGATTSPSVNFSSLFAALRLCVNPWSSFSRQVANPQRSIPLIRVHLCPSVAKNSAQPTAVTDPRSQGNRSVAPNRVKQNPQISRRRTCPSRTPPPKSAGRKCSPTNCSKPSACAGSVTWRTASPSRTARTTRWASITSRHKASAKWRPASMEPSSHRRSAGISRNAPNSRGWRATASKTAGSAPPSRPIFFSAWQCSLSALSTHADSTQPSLLPGTTAESSAIFVSSAITTSAKPNRPCACTPSRTGK